jgi:hypothetical protein
MKYNTNLFILVRYKDYNFRLNHFADTEDLYKRLLTLIPTLYKLLSVGEPRFC